MKTVSVMLLTLVLLGLMAHASNTSVVTKSNQNRSGIEFTLKVTPVGGTPGSFRITCTIPRTNALESLRAVELYSGAKPVESHVLLIRYRADLSLCLWRDDPIRPKNVVVTEFILPRELVKKTHLCLHVSRKRPAYSVSTGKKISMDQYFAHAIDLSTYLPPRPKREVKNMREEQPIKVEIEI